VGNKFFLGQDNNNGSDVTFFVSGSSNGAIRGSGVSVFGGDLVTSGVLNVEGKVSNDFVAKIDNDSPSAGHVLKLLTEGNGSGSRLLEMEDGDGDTVFRARADGRFGFGPNGVSSMGAGTFVVGIDGSHTADIAISKRLQHLGDSNTYMDFTAVDQIEFVAGGIDMIHMTEDDSQDMIVFNDGGVDVDFEVKSATDHVDGNHPALHLQGSSGRLGLGTNSPTSILHIEDSAPTVTIQRDDNANSSTLQFLGQAGATANMVHLATSNDLVFSTHNGSGQEEILRLGAYSVIDHRRIVMLSGSSVGPNSMQPSQTSDINFFVSGSTNSKDTGRKGTAVFGGDVVISGSLRAREINTTVHKYNPADNGKYYVNFYTNGSGAPGDSDTRMIAPYAGSLVKVMFRVSSACGNTVIGFHTNVDGQSALNGTAEEEVTVDVSSPNNSYTFNFGMPSVYGQGNIIGISVNPTLDPGNVILTAVWEFETYR